MALQTQLFVVYMVWHCRHNCMLCIWFGIADTNLAGFQCMNCLTKKVAFSNKSTSLASMIQVNVSKVSSNCFTFGMSWYTIDDQACKWKHKVRCNMLTGLYISFSFLCNAIIMSKRISLQWNPSKPEPKETRILLKTVQLAWSQMFSFFFIVYKSW